MRKLDLNVLEFINSFCDELNAEDVQLFNDDTGKNILLTDVTYGELKNMKVLSVIEPFQTKLHLRVYNSETVSE